MNALIDILPFLVVAAMTATLAVLIAGLCIMTNSELDRRYANITMRWRVGLQGLAVALMALMYGLTMV